MEPALPVVLAQFDLDSGAAVAPLPSAPFFERFVLENPWPVVIPLVLVGVAVVLIFNARAKLKTGLIVGGAFIELAGVAFVASLLVTTPREHMKQATRELVGATARVEVPELERLLSEGLTVRVTGLSRSAGKRETINAVETMLGRQYRVKDYAILELQATIDGPQLGRTQVRVRVESEYGLLPSWWRVDWERTDHDTWQARRIEALWIPGVSSPGG